MPRNRDPFALSISLFCRAGANVRIGDKTLRSLSTVENIPKYHNASEVIMGVEDGEMGSVEDSGDDGEVFHNPNRRLVGVFEDGEALPANRRLSWGSDQDASGHVRTFIFECEGRGQHPVVHCDVDPDQVLVGGGAWAEWTSHGALLTASYPENGQLETWVGASKDHLHAEIHTLHVYAVGLELTGLSRSELMSHMTMKEATSGSYSHPAKTVSVPAGYVLTGGGARVDWSGKGNLLTESYPLSVRTWKVASKDHIDLSPATITAYAIAIKSNIPGFGTIQGQRRSSSTYTTYGASSVTKNPTSGWTTTGMGGTATWSDTGRMLYMIKPNSGDGIDVSSKDHLVQDSGSTSAYVIELKKA